MSSGFGRPAHLHCAGRPFLFSDFQPRPKRTRLFVHRPRFRAELGLSTIFIHLDTQDQVVWSLTFRSKCSESFT
jgi:hypothetical protein